MDKGKAVLSGLVAEVKIDLSAIVGEKETDGVRYDISKKFEINGQKSEWTDPVSRILSVKKDITSIIEYHILVKTIKEFKDSIDDVCKELSK